MQTLQKVVNRMGTYQSTINSSTNGRKGIIADNLQQRIFRYSKPCSKRSNIQTRRLLIHTEINHNTSVMEEFQKDDTCQRSISTNVLVSNAPRIPPRHMLHQFPQLFAFYAVLLHFFAHVSTWHCSCFLHSIMFLVSNTRNR